MPEIISEALALPGLWGLVAAIIAAGLVRGFTGFGSALIIMPVASSVLGPFAALIVLVVVEFFGPLPNLPSAIRNGRPREAAQLWLGVAIGLPLGLWGLSFMSADVFSWIVSLTVFALLVLLITGWRYSGAMGPRVVTGIGSMGGFLAGIAGVPGPPVIMFYMASPLPIAVIRANFLLYLVGVDVLMISIFVITGTFDMLALTVGVICIPVYVLANVIGAGLFNPKSEGLFRTVAYCVIAASAVAGLPIWTM